jgi:sodium-dependent dicarboxylate transporter 2/3/5
MFPGAPEISFAAWFLFAFPITLFFLALVWSYLHILFRPSGKSWKGTSMRDFRDQYQQLGPVSFEEKAVFVIFILIAFLWLFRSDIGFGSLTIPGWSSLFGYPAYFNDGTVAIFASLLLFIIPAKNKNSGRLMDWEAAQGIPWNIVLLFGGGFALASGFKESGLSIWFGQQLSFVGDYHPFMVILVICFLMTFLTELTSNTATTEMLLPILAGLSISIEVNPLLFMLPATLSGSMAFMLPVATPPNAIVFGTGRLQVIDMARNGILLNLIGVLVIALFTWIAGTWIFDINLEELPGWVLQNH